MKSCGKCAVIKPFSEFNRSTRDGAQSYCKPCKSTAKKITKSDAKYYAKTRETRLIQMRDYYQKNREKLRVRMDAYGKEYAKRNQKSINARTAMYRALKLKATPSWLTLEQRRQIAEFYKGCPEGYEVDHIIPLRGENVCGLHVPWNLQYLTKSENARKNNRLVMGV